MGSVGSVGGSVGNVGSVGGRVGNVGNVGGGRVGSVGNVNVGKGKGKKEVVLVPSLPGEATTEVDDGTSVPTEVDVTDVVGWSVVVGETTTVGGSTTVGIVETGLLGSEDNLIVAATAETITRLTAAILHQKNGFRNRLTKWITPKWSRWR